VITQFDELLEPLVVLLAHHHSILFVLNYFQHFWQSDNIKMVEPRHLSCLLHFVEVAWLSRASLKMEHLQRVPLIYLKISI